MAVADYLGVKRPSGPILALITKQTVGATGTKRNKSCVDSATMSYTYSRKCGLFNNMGHYKDVCKLGTKNRVRLTNLTWKKIDMVYMVEDVVAACMVYPVVLSDSCCL